MCGYCFHIRSSQVKDRQKGRGALHRNCQELNSCSAAFLLVRENAQTRLANGTGRFLDV